MVCAMMLLGAAVTLGIALGIETHLSPENNRDYAYTLLLGLFIEGPDMMIKSTMATRIGQHHSIHSSTKVGSKYSA